MKIDTVVLTLVAVIAGLVLIGYFVALLVGVISTGGLLLPMLIGFVGIVSIFVVVLRQRLANSEDDHYEKIER